ncbi:MAG: NAD(+) synthase, partial [Prevotellaceae bacterium]|nr:NAD(+) synthase [Prevotellaceae bacterium]
MIHGFVKVAAAVPRVTVADCAFNAAQTEALIIEAAGQGVEIVVFPELGLTGYTCGDLFLNRQLLSAADEAFERLRRRTAALEVIA